MTDAVKNKPMRIGDLLISKGIINADQLRIALTEKKTDPDPVGKILVKLGFVNESVLRDALGESLGQDSVDLSTIVPDPEVLKLIPKTVARRYTVFPLSFDLRQQSLSLAMADTFNIVALDQISALIGEHIKLIPVLAGDAEIENAIDQFYGFDLSMEGILNELDTGVIDYQSLQAGDDEYSQPLVRLVDAILTDAVKRSASDIHFEPEEGFLRIRYRIDGVLKQIRTLHKNYWSGIAVRLKVMSDMNIAENRTAQDGRISLTLIGRSIDFRVASQPTTHGENIVLRILDRKKGIVPLEKLQLTSDALTQLKMMMARPEGIILVTGPTGSGKTTTLYSLLNHRNDESVNIMTLEDPVEYPMPMIRQTSVNEAAKLDFANGIRSIMRQDPDIILIGEIRDEDTAEMALRAAMTGHQVYSTLHTNSALGAIPRLLDIGVVPDIMAGNIIGVVAQRLIRKLCLDCREQYQPEAIEKKILDIQDSEEHTIYRATGCDHCDHTGYKGRLALLEILRIDADMDELIARRATMRELQTLANKKGFIPLADDGVRRILCGDTSLDEITRLIDLTSRVA
ncbi:Type II secretion system protein E [hydrothermal vent metagenome]|uniref:Type II secretion system protein E n=1 Tax=hydrothermal vent metagenome TaxID=652676 RepID=A0A3B0YT41_9ZZZZ